MRSRTSYFNRTLFLKTVTRFWPLWFIYFAVWFLAMPLALTANLAPTTYAWTGRSAALIMQRSVCSGAVYFGVIIGLVAACVAAMAVWSFMYSARSASGMASLPLRRECVFASVTLGGLAPLLAVNVLIFLICLGIQGYYGVFDPGIMGQWLAAVTLELVFFYGFALVCAQLTGNLAVLPLVYLVLNFTVYFVERLFENLMTYFVYGAWRTHAYTLTALSPPLGMIRYFNIENVYVQDGSDTYQTVGHYLVGWGALLAYAAVGLAFAALALWLYRRRRMESAGDVVAVNILKPVFKYCMTFGCALCVGALLYEYLGQTRDYTQWAASAQMTAFMLIGAFIGYFASEMLIHKSFRVWRGRWPGIGVSALVVIALMLSLELDLYGYERRVPEPGRVESVFIAGDGYDATLYAPENIAAVTRLHRSVVDSKRYYESFDAREMRHANTNSEYDTGPRFLSLYIDYELAGGSHMTRRYYGLGYYLGDADSQADARAAQTLLNTPEAIAWRKTTAIEYNRDTIFSASIECSILPGDVEKASGTTPEVYDGYGDRVAGKFGPGAQLTEAELAMFTADMSEYSAVWSFTSEEAAELYERCILPDMADGTIGTVWLISDEEYRNTVYDARISIDARMLRSDNLNSGYYSGYFGEVSDTAAYPGRDTGYDYDYFSTVPTVNSVRTNRWLAEHGVILRTLAETEHK